MKEVVRRIKHAFKAAPQTQEELINLLRAAHQTNLIDTETLTMIEGVVLFSQMKARDIMLPKKQMTCVPHDAELPEVIEIITQSGHSRFPLLDREKDEIVGIVHAKDLLRFQDPMPDILDIARSVTFVPGSKRLDLLLSEFRKNRNHMAIVVDEYGEVAGFVTLEDIIEQIIGDIEDEFDIDEEAYIKSHGEARYIIKAHTPVEEFNEQLQANLSADLYDTVGGIVLASFGYLPKRGETQTINHFQFKIINADARRIKLLECIDQRPSVR